MSHGEEGRRREDRTRYGLRKLPAHDYQEHLRGPILSRSASVRGVSGEEKTETEMEQLAAAITELTRFQREQQQRFEEAQKSGRRNGRIGKKKPGDANMKHISYKWH